MTTYSLTSFTTQTVIDTCPTTCSITAGTVNLFFWPTSNDYIYPSTYVDASLDYTFTSPSVYMLVDFIYGTNSQGIVGPSATSKIFALDLDEVSTIVGGTATEQLTLNDLGTDCPQSVDPTAIATLTDSRCDPILAAPSEVKSWAWPCNACGRFGLFDPPYAIPTITGGLIDTTTTTAGAATSTTTTAAATGAAPTTTAATTTHVAVTTTTSAAGAADTTSEVISLGPSGIVIVAYYSGTSFTTTIPTAASTVVYDGQTLTLGGDAATLPTVDASLTASTASASASASSASESSASASSASVSSVSGSSSSGPSSSGASSSGASSSGASSSGASSSGASSSTGADASTTTAGDPSTTTAGDPSSTSAPATGSAARNAFSYASLVMSVLIPIGMTL
ncbi:hypothetical protein LQW54_007153 [Pestalotiopsis sp. IQ-011]